MHESVSEALGRAIGALILVHANACDKHGERPQSVQGLIAFLPESGTVRCRWCDHAEEIGAPPWELPADVFDSWLCKLVTLGDRMQETHRACVPNPALNGVKARLMRLATADGVSYLNDDVHVGDEYVVFPHTRRVTKWGTTTSAPGEFVERESFFVAESKHGHAGFMPCELFDVRNH